MSNQNTQQYISEKDLADAVAKLPEAMTPERDLWSGIERAINQKQQRQAKQNNAFNPGAWAASILVVMLASWLVFSPSMEGQVPVIVKTQQTKPALQGQLVNFMQHNFQQQKQTLLVSYGKPSMEQLSPAMKKELKQLGDARASIRKALASDENNADLLNLLDFTQQQELKLLQQLYRQYQVI
jgi:hypothetical protein